ncbi:hypothetical protein BBR47_33520 [Brevibacillus brevis NBRC 100599]|uniref:Uncharacterized protein n=1 Tax=Brevibacillus brevis (strain 47 / JCM 6285 / NBRC 100599) TaxID=358681 RepID=C0ZEX0_BREBN|nr:hypothetical protein BBR47_33520 [Brevibacillus brevis NBRC 100599]
MRRITDRQPREQIQPVCNRLPEVVGRADVGKNDKPLKKSKLPTK